MNQSPPDKPERLLSDLQSIHDLLRPAAPGLAVDADGIPLLDQVVGAPAPRATPAMPEPPVLDQPAAPRPGLTPGQRTEASLIVQEVVAEFLPLIEQELRRRLETRLDQVSWHWQGPAER